MSTRRLTHRLAIGGVIAALTAVSTAAQQKAPGAAKAPARAAKNYTPAKTPWGDPDLTGVYTNKDESGIPIERPAQFAGKSLDDVDDSEFAEVVRQRNDAARARAPLSGGAETGAGPIHWFENYDARNSRAWLLTEPADGTIPPTTPEAQKRAADRTAATAARRAGRGPADSYEDRSLYDQCITRGLPGSMMPAIYGNSYEIHQGQGWVAIRYEMIHETRIIPLDGRAHASAKIPTYMGDGRGHFEGNTLVVETTNFRDPNRGASDRLKLIERFKPVAADKVEWSVTYDDATTWTRPWTFAMALTKDPTQAPFEYACHEGNYGLANILSAARAEEKAGK
ncbi:MAG: hypothetical protein ABI868_03710 [Acidobacteriota bacterium]